MASRSRKLVVDFLDEFLPERQTLADDFELPRFATAPEGVFESVDDLLAVLEARPTEEHAIYWASAQSTAPRGAIVAHTSDGKIVFGLSVNEDEEALAAEYLARMRSFSVSTASRGARKPRFLRSGGTGSPGAPASRCVAARFCALASG